MKMGIVTTDIGSVILHVEEGYLVRIELTEKALLPVDLPPFTSQLVEYFQKERTSFSLNFRMEGTDFQKKVWQTLMKIPYGSVVTYCGLSKELFGSEGCRYARAVGQALKRNSLPIVVPCHRVVAKNGLGGFSSGTRWKKYLLSLERGENLF